MRLVFAGTPAFSVLALEALVAAGHEVVGVFTQPDRPAGRGRKLSPSPVAECAGRLGLTLFKPERLRRNADALTQLAALDADVMVVVAYGLILPQAVLDIPRHGCLNIHASLLPRWRGAAPIQRAILAGDAQSGVTIMQMDAGLDTGPMLLTGATPIDATTTAGMLHDALATLGAQLIVESLSRLASGTLVAIPQPETGATYAGKIEKAEARMDWARPTAELVRHVHGFNPVPGAWSELGAERIKLLRAEPSAGHGEPGQVLALTPTGMDVATGDGALRILDLQRPGGRVRSAFEAYAGRSPGGCFS